MKRDSSKILTPTRTALVPREGCAYLQVFCPHCDAIDFYGPLRLDDAMDYLDKVVWMSKCRRGVLRLVWCGDIVTETTLSLAAQPTLEQLSAFAKWARV
jgi:hypothetical protein